MDPQTFANDVAFEGQLPDIQIRILGLDENAIDQWWQDFKNQNVWETASQNCSTVAASALKAGGGGSWYWWSAHNWMWKPDDVLSFARKLRARQNNRTP